MRKKSAIWRILYFARDFILSKNVKSVVLLFLESQDNFEANDCNMRFYGTNRSIKKIALSSFTSNLFSRIHTSYSLAWLTHKAF